MFLLSIIFSFQMWIGWNTRYQMKGHIGPTSSVRDGRLVSGPDPQKPFKWRELQSLLSLLSTTRMELKGTHGNRFPRMLPRSHVNAFHVGHAYAPSDSTCPNIFCCSWDAGYESGALALELLDLASHSGINFLPPPKGVLRDIGPLWIEQKEKRTWRMQRLKQSKTNQVAHCFVCVCHPLSTASPVLAPESVPKAWILLKVWKGDRSNAAGWPTKCHKWLRQLHQRRRNHSTIPLQLREETQTQRSSPLATPWQWQWLEWLQWALFNEKWGERGAKLVLVPSKLLLLFGQSWNRKLGRKRNSQK